jgi:hypothetical protein
LSATLVVRRDHIGEERYEEHGCNDEKAGHRAVIGAEITPEFAERMRRRGARDRA